MTKFIKTPVRSISYGDDVKNCVGLNPLSGALLDHSPRQRELWALRRSESQFESHSAVYLGTYFEVEVVGSHRAPEVPGLSQYDVETPKLPALTEWHAHEDIFNTVELPRIEAHETGDILLGVDGDDYVEHCPECGDVDGFHHRDCTIGGE